MKRIIMMLLVLAVVGGTTEVNAQSWLKKLGKTVENAAKRKIEQKAEEKTEKVVDDVFEGNIGKGNKNKKDKNNNAANNGNEVYDDGAAMPQDGGQQQGKSLEMTYAKSDFVPGDEIIFEDNLTNEQMGEFPSMWDLVGGNVEIASINGEKYIAFVKGGGTIAPLMKEMDSYLPEKYTIEFDFWLPNTPSTQANYYIVQLNDASAKRENKMYFRIDFMADGESQYNIHWEYTTTSGNRSEGKQIITLERDAWHHWAMSFNERAFKAYIDGSRITNIPNMAAANNFNVYGIHYQVAPMGIRNVRIAKGAVPLYDRMMSDGKFITYGITFDVGKSTIKPESMGEINRIVQLMNENPDLKFSVEGHTDSTGNAASNQTLSEARSQAIVAKLVEMGIAADRLTAVGKGQNNPIADNGTDEGRAKNRRVEFVKL